MSAYIITFPGSNCDQDAVKALNFLGYKAHILWHGATEIPPDAKLVILPGGFSWGDYLRCGAISASSAIMPALKDYGQKGGFILGICNGFQILCEAKLLPGALMRNKGQDFISSPCFLRVENNRNRFFAGYQQHQLLNFPIAHHDGCYWIDKQGLSALQKNNQILLRYSNAQGQVDANSNPNGSLDNIAAISNIEGNIVGMMPHPERNVDPLISLGILSGSGQNLFKNIMEGAAL